jgi:hypothetical protein
MTKNKLPSPKEFGQFTPPTNPQCQMTINSVGLQDEHVFHPTQIKIEQLPTSTKQFAIYLVLDNDEHNYSDIFQESQGYTLHYQHNSLSLHYRGHFKGVQIHNKLDRSTNSISQQLIFAAILISKTDENQTSNLLV